MKLVGYDHAPPNGPTVNHLATRRQQQEQQPQQLHLSSSYLAASDSRLTKNNKRSVGTQVAILGDTSNVWNNINNKSLGIKSNILSEFKPQSSNYALTSHRQLIDLCSIASQDDEEQMKIRLVERRYGDSKKVQLAAITIQRAFRKYQICKRFRAITEQLRHTCQSSSSIRPTDHKVLNRTETRDANNKQHTNSKCANDNKHRTSKQQNSCSTIFASGTTRAAAWESLSYAASLLEASAAAAAAARNTNEVTKSGASQQVASPSTTGSAKTSTDGTRIRSAASSNKSNHVATATINFQQFESIRKRQYRVGLNIFNKSPEKGISFLIAHSFIDTTPPYVTNSHSCNPSNQPLHFIDKNQPQQQHSTTASCNITNHNQSGIVNGNSFCRLCYDEENLKRNVAHFLLRRKGLAKERIGQYLGNLQVQFNQDVLVYYLQELDFHCLQIDIALRKFLSTLRLPGEAQKIERFVDYFADRYIQCQQQHVSSNSLQIAQHKSISRPATDGQQHRSAPPTPEKPENNMNVISQSQANYKSNNNLTLLSKDEVFILTFAIIMLNTDLHSPSLKPTSRMSASQFVHNLRGVFNSQTITENDLIEIYERVKANQITTTPDHVTHVIKVQQGLTVTNFQKKELPNLAVTHRRLVCYCRLFEVYDIHKKERVGQHQREIFLFNDLLLVTKLARRARVNATQQYAYRYSIPLQGLNVQLFQSTYYNFGIRICQRGSDEALIMFNALNKLDQTRFVDDLIESIAEMDEMENIRVHNIVDAIYYKHQDRLRRHALLHNTGENNNQQHCDLPFSNRVSNDKRSGSISDFGNNDENQIPTDQHQDYKMQRSQIQQPKFQRSKSSSMSNLSSVTVSE